MTVPPQYQEARYMPGDTYEGVSSKWHQRGQERQDSVSEPTRPTVKGVERNVHEEPPHSVTYCGGGHGDCEGHGDS